MHRMLSHNALARSSTRRSHHGGANVLLLTFATLVMAFAAGCTSSPPASSAVDSGGVASDTSSRIPDSTAVLTYVGRASVQNATPQPLLRAEVTVTNRGSSDTLLKYGGCEGIRVRVRRGQGPSSRLAWDEDAWLIAQAREPIPRICPDILYWLTVPAGESRTIESQVEVRHILGDSIPAGRYPITFLLQLSDTAFVIPAGSAELDL